MSASAAGPSVTRVGGGKPLPAVTLTCTVCGQAVYCGGPNCPNGPLRGTISTGAPCLPYGYDATSQISTRYLSVPVRAVSGPSAGFYVPAAGA